LVLFWVDGSVLLLVIYSTSKTRKHGNIY